MPLDDIQVHDHLSYIEKPIGILDKKMKTLHNKVVGLVVVLMATPKGLIVNMGTRGGDNEELPRVIYSNGLQGRSLIQVQESCNNQNSRYN